MTTFTRARYSRASAAKRRARDSCAFCDRRETCGDDLRSFEILRKLAMTIPTFHLSLGVQSLDESVEFYVRVLNATVAHRDPSGYVNLELFGMQLTLQRSASAAPPDVHFGFNLAMKEFERIAEQILAAGEAGIVMPPKIVDAGTPLERKKLYLCCPSGYLIELKGYGSS
jgi:extradiol dioxygenase family protein